MSNLSAPNLSIGGETCQSIPSVSRLTNARNGRYPIDTLNANENAAT